MCKNFKIVHGIQQLVLIASHIVHVIKTNSSQKNCLAQNSSTLEVRDPSLVSNGGLTLLWKKKKPKILKKGSNHLKSTLEQSIDRGD